MKTPEHILVPHDFSSCSRQALTHAIELAARTRAELHILHVEVIHSDGILPEEANKTKAQILHDHMKQEIIDGAAKHDLYVSDLSAIRYVVLRNVSASAAIVKYSSDYHIDLIVMGTHGRKGLTRTLLGSVAEEVVRLAPSTVLTVRETEDIKPLSEFINTIVVPFDFSEYSRSALHYAKDLAASFGATLEVVHVIEENIHPAFSQAGISSIYDIKPDIEKKALKAMRSFYEVTGPAYDKVRFVTLHGNPSREILERLTSAHADMLVISTHGLTGLKRALIGSVAEKLIREVQCPVITLKSTEPAFQTISPFASSYEHSAV